MIAIPKEVGAKDWRDASTGKLYPWKGIFKKFENTNPNGSEAALPAIESRAHPRTCLVLSAIEGRFYRTRLARTSVHSRALLLLLLRVINRLDDYGLPTRLECTTIIALRDDDKVRSPPSQP